MYLNVMQATTIFNIFFIRAIALLTNNPYPVQEVDSFEHVLQNATFSIFALIVIVYFKIIRKREIPQIEYTYSQYVFMTIGIFGAAMLIGSVEAIMKSSNVVTVINSYECFAALFCIIFIVVIIWLSFSIRSNVEYKKEKEMMELYMDKQEEYIKNVVEKDEQMRRFRHDISGHLSALQGLLEVGEQQEIVTYIEQIEDKVKQAQVEQYSGNKAVDAIIKDMQEKMKQKDIKLVWEGTVPIDCQVATYDLCTVFMNLIQNGMDACEKLQENRQVEVKVNDYNGKLYITEENRIVDNVLLDDKGNPKTDKADKRNHGLGSKNVREVVEKYNGKLNYHIVKESFKIEIMI